MRESQVAHDFLVYTLLKKKISVINRFCAVNHRTHLFQCGAVIKRLKSLENVGGNSSRNEDGAFEKQ